jgi:hypothetical protein
MTAHRSTVNCQRSSTTYRSSKIVAITRTAAMGGLSLNSAAMRQRAFILFVPLMAFLIETASFTPFMQAACAFAANGIDAEEGNSCCVMTPETGSCQNTEGPEEPVDNDCTDSPCCYNCPVCYNFLFERPYELPPLALNERQQYQRPDVAFISTYLSEVWNPPDGLHLHT